jgi:hypothetical protein
MSLKPPDRADKVAGLRRASRFRALSWWLAEVSRSASRHRPTIPNGGTDHYSIFLYSHLIHVAARVPHAGVGFEEVSLDRAIFRQCSCRTLEFVRRKRERTPELKSQIPLLMAFRNNVSEKDDNSNGAVLRRITIPTRRAGMRFARHCCQIDILQCEQPD